MVTMTGIILTIAFLIRTLRLVFYHLFWWEIKEYRFDRMFVHLQETQQGRQWLFNPLSLGKWVLLFILLTIGYGFFEDYSSLDLQVYFLLSSIIYVIYLLEALKSIYQLKNGWLLPPLKPRNIGIFVASLFTIYLIVILTAFKVTSLVISYLIIDKLLGLIVSFWVFISNLIFTIYKKRKISKAILKMQGINNLKVIGITGSYGKTTTKELIAQLLSRKYRVLKTLGSQNTDIGIAERILGANLQKYDYFICEMAAYKKGEIAAICQMLIPKIEIGVITGINEQHQSLFGSLENTQQAKFELIEAIKPSGLAVFNGKSRHIENMVVWAKEKGIKIIVENAAINKLPLQIHGAHFQENLSIAITVAGAVGITKSEINKIIGKLQLPDKTMNVVKKGNLYVIDNTFNSNPDGVYAALTYLKTFKGTKVLVLQPLIELGKYTGLIHKKIGKMAANICDLIVLTNKNFNYSILEGVNEEKDGNRKVYIGTMPNVSEGVILFQGKESEKYLKSLNSI